MGFIGCAGGILSKTITRLVVERTWQDKVEFTGTAFWVGVGVGAIGTAALQISRLSWSLERTTKEPNELIKAGFGSIHTNLFTITILGFCLLCFIIGKIIS
jgi:hypothetical protein